ncbi:hypothetical protein [Streptomyces sp. NPDC057966]|uniref:hypothetical protein n=1 Tax=Streptomyces sp. NPDC057966 TaxID=3346292 RepID=UPI0036EF3699
MPTVKAFLAAAGGSVAVIAGYGFVSRTLKDGNIVRLSLGLGLCALTAAAAGAFLWLQWGALADAPRPARTSHDTAFRWDVVVSVVALPAEVSLSWLTVVLADEHTGAAWLAGGVALALAPVWLYRLCGDLANRHGIPVRAARNSALAALAADLPSPILADLTGMHRHTAIRWVTCARRDWAEYLAAPAEDQ